MNDEKISGWVFQLLKWFCPARLYEEIEGDLIQKFNRDVNAVGKKRAKRILIWNAIRFLRPGILLRNKLSILTNKNLMFRNHAKIVIRQAIRNKAFSIINILGLTSGIAVSLLISQFVWFEWSFDDFNKNADRIYRANLYNTQNGVFDKISPGTVSGLAYSIKQAIPNVELTARIGDKTSVVVSDTHEQVKDKEDIVFADPAIISILGLEFLDGDEKTALNSLKSIIISESAARKYFGNTHVVGQNLEIGFSSSTIEKKAHEVRGVFRDLPPNSHQHFEFVLPPENEQRWDENWSWSNVTTYIQLPQHVKPIDLESSLSKIVRQHHVDSISDRYLLEPIDEIRLHALDGTGRASIVNFFMLLGVIILLLAWFNYINLSTARFFERMKEVGIRKLIGASRMQLTFQLLVESFFFNLIAFSGALILFYFTWPYVTTFLTEEIPITLFKIPGLFLAFTGFIFLSTLMSGIYPSIFLSGFQPLQSLKGKINNSIDRSTLRKVLVGCQFAVSIVLITGVLAIQRQVDFMQSQDLGLSIDQTLVIEEPLLTDPTTVERYQSVKHELLQIPHVKGVTYSSSFPGAEIGWHRTDITVNEENANFRYDSRIISIGTEFIDVFGLPLLAGRNFNDKIESDNKAMLINEAASKMFGFTKFNDALGKLIFIGSRRFEVIGVVKNHHYRSLQNEIQPVLYMQGYPRNPRYAIKIAPQHVNETIAEIEAKWNQAYDPNVFHYYFLSDFFDRQYTTEQQLGTIVTALTLMAIFISCSGLFALSLYSVSRRTKEISIRKVFGATISNVVMLLSLDFLKLLVIGGIIAVPLSYQGIGIWLEGYAYKMPIDVWLFVIPIGVVLILAIITISFKTITAARMNPVENMKYE